MATPQRILDDLIQPDVTLTATGEDMGYTPQQIRAALDIIQSVLEDAGYFVDNINDTDSSLFASRLVTAYSYLNRPIP